jgi:ubiquinone/menaquinone biosynthesis C-methylase UbiE
MSARPLRHTGQLVRAYGLLARGRNITAGNPKRWGSEAIIFTRYTKPYGRILDIGCGAGRDALLLPRVGEFKYTGVDASHEMLVEARKLAPTVQFVHGDMYTLPFPDGSFDGFWAAASLLHVPKYYIGRVLAEAHRILCADGVGFIALKEGTDERVVPGPLPGADRFFSFWQQDEFRHVLIQNRFRVLDSYRRKLSPEDSTTWLTFFVQALQ